MKAITIYICPVCAAFFDDDGYNQAEERTHHCIKCDHHYPLDQERCHNCKAEKQFCYAVQPTTLTFDDVIRLGKWSKQRGYKRGVEMLYTPDGQIYEGGIRIK